MTLERKSLTKENIDLAEFNKLFESIYKNNREVKDFILNNAEKEQINTFTHKVINDIIANKNLSNQEKVEKIGAFLKNPFLLINDDSVAKIIFSTRNSYEEVRKINALVKANLVKLGITNTNNNIINSTKIKNLITNQKQPEFNWRNAWLCLIGACTASIIAGTGFAIWDVNQNKTTKNSNPPEQNEQLADQNSEESSFKKSQKPTEEYTYQPESYDSKLIILNGLAKWNNNPKDYEPSAYLFKFSQNGNPQEGGIYEEFVKENKIYNIVRNGDLTSYYQPALLKLDPKNLVWFGNYPEKTYHNGILNTKEMPLEFTKKFSVDFSHNRDISHKGDLKFYIKLQNPTNQPTVLNLNRAFLLGNAGFVYTDIANQQTVASVETLNAQNITTSVPGLALSYYKNYGNQSFAGRPFYLNHNLVSQPTQIVIPVGGSVILSANYINGENMGNVNFEIASGNQNLDKINITTAVGNDPREAFSKESILKGEEKQSRRSSGVTFNSNGEMFSQNPIKINGDKFEINGKENVDLLGTQYLGYFSSNTIGVNINTPMKTDTHNLDSDQQKQGDRQTNYGDYHTLKTMHQKFETPKPTTLQLTFVPRQLNSDLRIKDENPSRKSVPKYSQKIEQRDIVKITITDENGSLISEQLVKITLTPVGQGKVEVNLPAGEITVTVEIPQSINNSTGDGGESMVVEVLD
jgi:hypothetical protein